MAVRNGFDNPASLEFVGNLASSPLADWSARTFRSLTGKLNNTTDDLSIDPDRLARTRRIAEAVNDSQVFQGDRLEGQPTLAPQTYGIDIYLLLLGNDTIILAISSS
jgi:hypothetical protein